MNEQLSREPKKLPTLNLNSEGKSIFELETPDIIIENYDPHPKIKAPLPVIKKGEISMISLLVAHDPNRVIGVNNELPWHIPEDLAYFKKMIDGQSDGHGAENV